jgi:hypothetical protein
VAMVFAYTGDNIASSFCERMNSAAKNVLTDSRTLLDDEQAHSVEGQEEPVSRPRAAAASSRHPGSAA